MSDRKPSEILRPYFADSGYLRPDKVLEYTEAVFAILNRLHAATGERAEKVEAPVVPKIVKWTRLPMSDLVYGYDLDDACWSLGDNGWIMPDIQRRYPEEVDITTAEAIALQPDIAKTHPLPTVKPPLTVEPLAPFEKVVKWCDGCVETISERLRETDRADAAEARVRELETIIREYVAAAEKTLGTRTEGGGA